MDTIGNYYIESEISATSFSRLYRGVHRKDERKVLLKVITRFLPTKAAIAQYHHEYTIIKDLHHSGVVEPYEFIQDVDTCAIAFEDVDGVNLASKYHGTTAPVDEIFQAALSLSETLSYIHSRGVIHRDVKPYNILYCKKENSYKLTDFGIAVLTSSGKGSVDRFDVRESLPYISPEQTGRMNISVDYRTDLYSLGITLYELATGSPPFIFDDPGEIIYGHLALTPPFPSDINQSIPRELSHIIIKLLNKNPSDRYQGSSTLRADLGYCYNLYKNGSHDESFVPDTLVSSIPDFKKKIFIGRSEDLGVLKDAVERTSWGLFETVLVEGSSGTGKTLLMQNLEQYCIENRGYFLSGKYERNRTSVPFSSFIVALNSFIRIMLSGKEEDLKEWKKTILQAVEDNASVLIDVFPDLELVLGNQPQTAELTPDKSLVRFNRTFAAFIRAISSHTPLFVLFLDDLQWADTASIELLSTIINEADSWLLIVLAYRDDEIEENPQAYALIQELQSSVTRIVLKNFSHEEVRIYLQNLMGSDFNRPDELVSVIMQKTMGNPFNVYELMNSIYDQGIIDFSQKDGWTWNQEKLTGLQISDSAGNILIHRMNQLPGNTREILSVASTIGGYFFTDDIMNLTDFSLDEIINSLNELAREGFIIFDGRRYSFGHDRILEEAYNYLPDNRRAKLHWVIGTKKLEETPREELDDVIYYVVNHLNKGAREENMSVSREAMIQYNIKASQKAFAATAFSGASSYLFWAYSFLPDDPWETVYEITYEIQTKRAECELYNSNISEAEELLHQVISRAKTSLHRAKVYNKLVILRTSRSQYHDAVNLGLKGLKELGVVVPSHPNKITILKEYFRVKYLLMGKKKHTLLNAAVVTDEEISEIMSLFMNAGTAAYFTDKNQVAVMSLKLISYTLRKGNSDLSSFSFISYGIILVNGFKKYREADHWGSLAIELNGIFQNISLTARIRSLYALLINHWSNHIDSSLSLLKQAYKEALNNGDYTYAVFSSANYIQTSIRRGEEIEEVLQEIDKYKDFIANRDTEEFVAEVKLMEQYLHALKGDTIDLKDLSSDDFSEESLLQTIEKFPLTGATYYGFKMILNLLYGDVEEAERLSDKIFPYIDDFLAGQFSLPDFYFYTGLVHSNLWRIRKKNKKSRRIFRLCINKIKTWAEVSPENNGHKLYLLMAEYYSNRGDNYLAEVHYDKAVSSARDNRFTHNQAIAAEYASYHYLRNKRLFLAKSYMHEAVNIFSVWGAEEKIHRLKNLYPDLLRGFRLYKDQELSSSGSQMLDISAVMKTSQVISGELVMNKLLSKLVHVIGQATGATTVFFITVYREEAVVEAHGSINNSTVDIVSREPVASRKDIAASVVNYVVRTGNELIIDSLGDRHGFIHDPCLSGKTKGSLLCLPIASHTKTIAYYYAENNLISGAFTPRKLEMLKILLSYAAMAFENARLFSDLEQQVKERTEELQSAYDSVNEAYFIIKDDLNLAKQIQQKILPRDIKELCGIEPSIHYYPMTEVGGDIYDIFHHHSGKERIFLADATGHGIQAALITMIIKSEYEMLKNSELGPGAMMSQLNDIFSGTYGTLSMFFTCIIVDVDCTSRTITYASAGHPDQILIVEEEMIFMKKTGRLIGFMSGVDYGEVTHSYSGESKLLLYSDGIYEEYNTRGMEYGEERLRQTIVDNILRPVELVIIFIIDDILKYLGSDKLNLHDDVTIIGLDLS